MRRERRQLTHRELEAATSRRPVVRRIKLSSATNSLTKSSVNDEREERSVVVLDPVRIEAAEASIDRFILQRSASKDKANLLAQEWAASEKRRLEKRRAEHRELWLDYHRGQAARLRHTMEVLIARHEAAAAQLLEGAGES